MMAGTASAGIGLIQLLMGIGIGGFFSLFVAGALWTGVALRQANRKWHEGRAATPPNGLWLCRCAFLGCAVVQGARMLVL
jgi:hypothetical protein